LGIMSGEYTTLSEKANIFLQNYRDI
jgi:hypothetical protein